MTGERRAGVIPDRVERLHDLVRRRRAALEQPLVHVAGHGGGDVRDAPPRPFQIGLDGMADEGLPLLRAQSRAGAILVHEIAEIGVRPGDVFREAAPQPIVEFARCLACLWHRDRRIASDQMPLVVAVIVEGGGRLLDVGDEALDLRVPESKNAPVGAFGHLPSG